MATIFLDYLYWHFAIAPLEILKIMSNYLKAARHQFLMVQHLKTLFSPWHRQNPSDFGSRERTFADKIMDVLADMYIRLIAAGIRFMIIICGLIWQLLILLFFILIFILWLCWPLIVGYLIGKGLTLISII